MQDTEKSNEKRTIINVIRGFALFLMLWGHSIQSLSIGQFDFFDNHVFKFIYSFHMPLFMLISGYLFFYSAQKRELYPLIHSKTRSLFRPIVMVGVFNYLITKGLGDLVLKKNGYLSVLDGKWLSGIESLWFLWSVLAASYVVAVIEKNEESTSYFCVVGSGYFRDAVFPQCYI